MKVKLYLILAMILFIGCVGCTPVRVQPTTGDLVSVRSPALLPYCGVPVAGLYNQYKANALAGRLPRRVGQPIAWSHPLQTESLAAILSHWNCIRICRPSDPYWHWINYESLVLRGDKITLLDSEEDVAEFLNANTFMPASQAECESVLFAFAELCGYQILTKQPEIPDRIKKREEKQKEAERLDWSTSWVPHERGWKVSCVMVTNHSNRSSKRYTILIFERGGIQIVKREHFFFTHCIR